MDIRHRVQHGAIPAEAVCVVGVGGWGAGFWGRVVALVVPRLILGTTEHVLHPLFTRSLKQPTAVHGGGRNGNVRYSGDDPGDQVKHLSVLMSVVAEGESQVHDEGVQPESRGCRGSQYTPDADQDSLHNTKRVLHIHNDNRDGQNKHGDKPEPCDGLVQQYDVVESRRGCH